jgi:hypothetical protein
MRPGDLRRWVDGYRAAQERERREALSVGPEPGTAVASALALVALAGRLHGWPIAPDEADRRESAAALASWDRLRAVVLSRGRAR